MEDINKLHLAGNFRHPKWTVIAKSMLEWTAEDTGINPSAKLNATWQRRLEKLNCYLQEIVCDMVAEYVFTGQSPFSEEDFARMTFHHAPETEALITNLREFVRLEQAGENQAIRDAVWNKHLREFFRILQLIIQETYEYSRHDQKDVENQSQAFVPAPQIEPDKKQDKYSDARKALP